MTNDEKAMYTGMAMCRNTEVTLRWARSQMFMLINSAMFSLVFTQQKAFWKFAILSWLGVLLCVLWFLINHKTQQWVEYWQTRLAQIKHEEEPSTVNVFIGPEWDRINKGSTFYRLISILPIAFAMFWFTVFVYSCT